jgi:hypothetical protein
MDFQTHLFMGAWHDDPAFGVTANPGIGLLVRESDFLAGAGVWRNSVKETVPYGFVGYQPLMIGPVRVGGVAGATKYFGKTRGLAGALFTYTFASKEWHLLVTPRVKNLAPTTVMLSASF